ncbi:MAG: hypothetical protein R3F11_16600 [Verrucomicrobiales bacterium]
MRPGTRRRRSAPPGPGASARAKTATGTPSAGSAWTARGSRFSAGRSRIAIALGAVISAGSASQLCQPWSMTWRSAAGPH